MPTVSQRTKRTPSPKSSMTSRKPTGNHRSLSKKSSSLTTAARTTPPPSQNVTAHALSPNRGADTDTPVSLASPPSQRNRQTSSSFSMATTATTQPTCRDSYNRYSKTEPHSSSAQGHKATQKRHYYRKHASAIDSPVS